LISVTLRSTTGASFAGYIIAAKDQATMNTIHGSFTNAATGKTLACGSSVSSLLILIYKILKLKTKFTIYQRYFYYQFMYSTLLVTEIKR
jgi:hypothetical protein